MKTVWSKHFKLTKQEIQQIDTRTFLYYAAYADFCDLSSALPLEVQMCGKYDEQLLKQAGIETLISDRIMMK